MEVNTFWKKLTTFGRCGILPFTNEQMFAISSGRSESYLRKKTGDPGTSGDQGYAAIRVCTNGPQTGLPPVEEKERIGHVREV